MLALINKYGLIHVCAKPEYNFNNQVNHPYLDLFIDYQFLDLYDYYNPINKRQMSIYFRGTLDRSSRLENLFEYLLLLSLNNYGFIYPHFHN